MAFHPDGVKFVLTAPDTESTEQAFSPWKQMMYASAPAQFVPRFFYKNKFEQPRNADGSAKVMTYGVRVAEEVLRRAYPDDDVVVCYPDDLGTFVGGRTVAVGVGAHNPIGTAFSTGVYSNIFGSSARPINAAESERVYQHPAIESTGPRSSLEGRRLADRQDRLPSAARNRLRDQWKSGIENPRGLPDGRGRRRSATDRQRA